LSPTLRSASNRIIEDFTTEFGSSQLENWRYKREISQGISILITSTCEVHDLPLRTSFFFVACADSHPRHSGDRTCTTFVADFQCRRTFIGLGKYHRRPPFPFPSSSSPQPAAWARPAATDLDLYSSDPAESFFLAAFENSKNGAHPLPLPRDLGAAATSSTGGADTDVDRCSGNPTDWDLRNDGSLSMSRDMGPTAPTPVPRPTPPSPASSAEEGEEDEAEEEGEGKQPQGRTLAQSGHRRRRRSRRQAGQTP
ncbi:unnamed protein product, partial [Musa hybrid cultivar]